METMTKRLMNRDVEFEQRRIPLSQLRLDPSNPRIQYQVRLREGSVTEEMLHDALWNLPSTKQLMASIRQNGGVIEPIYAMQKALPSGELVYLVKEGNRRTVALREAFRLAKSDDEKKLFASIPAWVPLSPLSEMEWDIYLAEIHVAGKKEWDAYEQAHHVWRLENEHGLSWDFICRQLAISRSKLSELKTAYGLTNQYLKTHRDPENVRKFSFFHELVKRKPLRQLMEIDEEFAKQFMHWIHSGKLTHAIQVRDLTLILDNSESRKALEDSGFDAAKRILYSDNPDLESKLFGAVKKMSEILKDAPIAEITDLHKNPHKINMLRELQTRIRNVATIARIEL